MIFIFDVFFIVIMFVVIALDYHLFFIIYLMDLVRFLLLQCLIASLMSLIITFYLLFSFIIWKDALIYLLHVIRSIFFRKVIYLYVLLSILLIFKDYEYTYHHLLRINNRFNLYLIALILLFHMVIHKLLVKLLVVLFSFWALILFQFYNYFINKFITIW